MKALARGVENVSSREESSRFKLILVDFADGGFELSLHMSKAGSYFTYPPNWIAQ